MRTTTFETAKAGDKVLCMIHGWGEVWEAGGTNRQLLVEYSGEYVAYTLDGLDIFYDGDICRTLFWDEVVIDAPVKPYQT